MGDGTALAAHQVRRVPQELIRGRALPLRIVRWKMDADIARAQGTQKGVGQCVEPGIGVGMTDQRARVRNLHAAEPEMVAGAECVHVESLTGADVAQRGAKASFRVAQIVLGRHLEIILAAGHEADRDAGVLGDRGIVGQIEPPGRAMRLEYRGIMEALRRLRAPEVGAVDRPGDRAVGGTLHRVAQRQSRNRTRRMVERAQHAVDDRGVNQRSRRIVDQHAARRQLRQALEAEPHRFLPHRAARDRRQESKPLHGGMVAILVFGIEHHAHAGDGGVMLQRFERMTQDRGAAERQVLLWTGPAETRAAARRDDQGDAIEAHGGQLIGIGRRAKVIGSDLLRGAMTRVVEPVEPIERASIDELRALQLTRLKAVLRHVDDHVPHYHSRFAEAGVAPGDLRDLSDLAKFPLTGKDDLRLNYPFGMFAVPMRDIVRIHASSGTTGKPTVAGYTRRDIEVWAGLMARSIRAAGGTPDDMIHVAYGYGLFTGGLGAHYGGEHLGAAVIPMGGGSTERQVQLINDFKPDIIMVTPSYMLAIADAFERQGLSARDCSLRIGIFGAEPWSEGMRAEIERVMGLDALDIYGLSEVMGPGVAQECLETKDGPTIWEDHFYPEIIDPETGHPVADGVAGELVLTTLTKEAMPLIRFRTRDLTRLLPGTARSMRRMERVRGRSDDMLIIRGVNLFPSQIEAVLAQERRLAPHYLLELHRAGRLDELVVVVETRPGLDSPDQADIAGNAERLIKAYAGVSARVRLVASGALERSQGKAKRVTDLRPKE